MSLLDALHRRTTPPIPWAEDENIPWHDPDFSRRMLREHLDQTHNLASRTYPVIDEQILWIWDAASLSEGSKVVDLACGPGFYSDRLASRGCECLGVDFSPAAIDHAQEQAVARNLNVTYALGDIRTTDYGVGNDLILLLFGEFNVFRKEDARQLLTRAHTGLNETGTLILEPSRFSAFGKSSRESSWRTFEKSVFSDNPHTALEEVWWDAEAKTETRRYYIIDGESDRLSSMGSTSQAYTDEDYRSLLGECGFTSVAFYPSLIGEETDVTPEMMVVVARK